MDGQQDTRWRAVLVMEKERKRGNCSSSCLLEGTSVRPEPIPLCQYIKM